MQGDIEQPALPMLTDLPPGETALALTDVGLLEISRGSFETLRRCSPPLAFRLSSTVMACHAKRLPAALLRVADTRSSVARAQT